MMEDFSVPVDGFFNPFRPGPKSSSNPTNTDETSSAPSQLERRSLLDEALKDLRRQLHSVDHDIGWTARHFGVPRKTSRSPYYLCPSLESIERRKEAEPGKYRINIPLGTNIRPENVKVSLKDRVMTIEAKKEENSVNGTGRMYQEYVRRFTLPEKIDMKQVKSVLTSEGFLTIEAPLPQPILGDKYDRNGEELEHVGKHSEEIPIDRTSDDKPSSCFLS